MTRRIICYPSPPDPEDVQLELHRQINDRDLECWTVRLNCTPDELRSAIAAVGTQALAVEIFIRGSRTGGQVTPSRARRRTR